MSPGLLRYTNEIYGGHPWLALLCVSLSFCKVCLLEKQIKWKGKWSLLRLHQRMLLVWCRTCSRLTGHAVSLGLWWWLGHKQWPMQAAAGQRGVLSMRTDVMPVSPCRLFVKSVWGIFWTSSSWVMTWRLAFMSVQASQLGLFPTGSCNNRINPFILV